MNNLNQILIEGEIVGSVVYRGKEISFQVESRRFFRNEEKSESVTIWTIADGILPDHVKSALRSGRMVRVIGRIRNSDGGTIAICADHVIIKPEPLEPTQSEIERMTKKSYR